MAEILGMGMSELKDREAARELGLNSHSKVVETTTNAGVEDIGNSRTRRSRIRLHLYHHPEELRENYWH